MSAEIAEILEKAADLIEARGLCKGTLSNMKGEHCSGGALLEAAGHSDLGGFGWASMRHEALRNARVAAAVLAELDNIATLPEPLKGWTSENPSRFSIAWRKMVAWNNAPERTADEVIEAMRQAAKNLRNEATP